MAINLVRGVLCTGLLPIRPRPAARTLPWVL